MHDSAIDLRCRIKTFSVYGAEGRLLGAEWNVEVLT
jgi:hypothetical protein